ncbi:MAG: aminoacyl-tRNA deacylase [Myxococcota bacterium]
MSIAKTVKWYLDTHHVSYEILQHPHTTTSEETANAAYIWGDQLAKSVLLEDERGYVLVVLPASRRVDLRKLRAKLGRKLEFATEGELGQIFRDCETGAIPPLGAAYGIPVAYDDHLRRLGSVYFEGGDHQDLVYMGGVEFASLFQDSPHGDFAATA